MVSLRRIERTTEIVHSGRTVALVEANWLVLVGRREGAAALSYRSPRLVEINGKPSIRIRDHVLLVRLGALALTTSSMLWILTLRRKRR